MSLKVYNTLTRRKEEFIPFEAGKVRMYVCGPTVYNFIHIGNGRCYVAFDIIYRYLKHKGYEVTYVRNLTDVDDKIINRAAEEGVAANEVANKYTAAFHEDMGALGNLTPDIEPKATEHIAEMVDTIAALIEKGFAYEVGGDVFFEVDKFPAYGKLSGCSLDDMRAGERVCVDERKCNPLDFALWKSAKEGEPSWDSPWGKGRPGWHIECSAMSSKYLGASFDIHGGGQDLIFPHHENEIAQTEALSQGRPFAKYWLHNGFVNMGEEKMAKSLGNVVLVRDILKEHDVNAVRLFFAQTHYRSPITYTSDNVKMAAAALEKICNTLENIDHLLALDEPKNTQSSDEFLKIVSPFEAKFTEAMDDDFNTAAALGHLFEFIREVNTLIGGGEVGVEALKGIKGAIEGSLAIFGINLGLNQEAALPGEILELARGVTGSDHLDKELALKSILKARDEARRAKDWARADEIRDRLTALGFTLKDTPSGLLAMYKGE
ncbi:MAG: cysteine--tRNA ligase [Actinomycetota bacterium]|nr:cysteine--tRNA ligase [Actinomycetota bacterium]